MNQKTLFDVFPESFVRSFHWYADLAFWKNLVRYAIQEQNITLAEDVYTLTKPDESKKRDKADWVKKWNELHWELLMDELESKAPSKERLDFFHEIYRSEGILATNGCGTLQKLFLKVNSNKPNPTAWASALGNDESLDWVKRRMLVSSITIPGKQLEVVPKVLAKTPARAHRMGVRNRDSSTRLAEFLNHVRTQNYCKASEDAYDVLLSDAVWRSAFLYGSETLWNELDAWQTKHAWRKAEEPSQNQALQGIKSALISTASFDSYVDQTRMFEWVDWIVSKDKNLESALEKLEEIQQVWTIEWGRQAAVLARGQRAHFNNSQQPRQQWWGQAVERVKLKAKVSKTLELSAHSSSPGLAL